MRISLIALILILLLSSGTLFSQNWADVDPKMNNILVDNDLLRSTIAVMEPGEISKLHTHPAHFFYALTDGKIKVHYSDGTSETIELKAGEYGYSDPEKPHMTENISDKTIKFLLVELKEHPYKK